MSTDGIGNIQSDAAYDTLADLIEALVNDVRRIMNYDSSTSLFADLGESIVMPSIDIIILLCGHYGTYPHTIKSIDEVRIWKDAYLDTFDRTIHNYVNSLDFIQKRRDVIAQTFDRLYELVKEMLDE